MLKKIIIMLCAGLLLLACSKTTKPSESVAKPTLIRLPELTLLL